MDSTWVDVAFPLAGGPMPHAYREALHRALALACPWLAQVAGAAVHPLKLSTGGGGAALLSGRTRLVLRLPPDKAEQARGLQGTRLGLGLGEAELRLGAPVLRPVLPWGTLYAHLVVSAAGDEAGFMAAVALELQGLGVRGRAICGRRQAWAAEGLAGHGLMVDGLSAADSLRLQRHGLGSHRHLGCGVFVPHKSAAAVGSPD